MDVRKTIAELTSQLSEINYDSEEDNLLINDDLLHCKSEEENYYSDVKPSILRKTSDPVILPNHVYGGRTTSRKKSYPLSNDTLPEEFSDDESKQSSIQSDEASINSDDENSPEEGISSEGEESHKFTPTPTRPNKNEDDVVDYYIYSAGTKNIPSDIKKGTAIRNQLRVWESFLECRIKLQKALVACNNLPRKSDLLEVKVQLDSENQLNMNKCKMNLLLLLDKLVDLQKDLLKQCFELNNKKENYSDADEEIESEGSKIGSDKEEDEGQPTRKKRKLNEYSSLIKDNHAKYIPFRNASIQKWNDKTKVSSGKMASTNFSSFDHSTLKQIEQIMADKNRLVNRTRIKRNEFQGNNIRSQGQSQDPQETTLDAEIFDDTDFYHKLLRDYIERKSVDVTNSSHTERQMVELQKLRSKMKKSVDTKSTKGRRLRYVVLPKLVNFMAPDSYNTWTEEAETELYNSLFGKIKV